MGQFRGRAIVVGVLVLHQLACADDAADGSDAGRGSATDDDSARGESTTLGDAGVNSTDGDDDATSDDSASDAPRPDDDTDDDDGVLDADDETPDNAAQDDNTSSPTEDDGASSELDDASTPPHPDDTSATDLDAGGVDTDPETNVTDAAARCVQPIALRTGMNYGPYALFAIRLDGGIEPGEYVLSAEIDASGLVEVTKDGETLGEFTYDPESTFEESTPQTLVFDGYFELDVASTTIPDLGGLGEAIFDGCHAVSVSEVAQIEQGGEYGPFTITALDVAVTAAGGTYTFYAESGNAGSVELRFEGEAVDTLEYAWTTTVGGGASYTFEFPGVVSFEVTRSMGTSNLFGLAEVLFDGRSELVIP